MERIKFTSIRGLIRALGCIAVLTLAPAIAQQNNTALGELRAMKLKEEPGPVALIYSPSAEERALKYRDSLQAARAWFEQQLGIRVPLTLAVLDKEAWMARKTPAPWAMPGARLADHLVIFPSRIEDYLHKEASVALPGEYVIFHEAGHIFAIRGLNIRSGNVWVNELIANMFMAAYIQRKRPDLTENMQRRAHQTKLRYTSLADLDYLYSSFDVQNYLWFKEELTRIAEFLVADQKLADVAAKLQQAFPADKPKQESLARIIEHLETIRPGIGKILGDLGGPSTLPAIHPTSCAAASGSPQGVIAVRNETGKPLEVNTPQGPVTIAVGGWLERVRLNAGESVKLPDGTCLFAGAEPGLALIAKPEDRWAKIPGARIHYTDSGGNGEPIILLHALTGSTDPWANQIPAFVQAGFRVIAYDRRGFGLTTADSSDSTDADDLAAFLDALHLDRVNLVGTGAGGGVALDFTISFPSRVLRLADADSTGASKDPRVAEMRSRLSIRRMIEITGRRAEFSAHRELSPSYRASNPEGTRQWIEIYEHTLASPSQPNQKHKSPMTLADCEKIRTPTLLITGGADQNAPPPLIDLMAAHIPNSKVLVIHDAGHSAFWEQPDVFNRAVLDFLRKPTRHESPSATRVSLGDARSVALLSPDGSVVLLWDREGDLRLRRLADGLPRQLHGTEGASMPFWAGDSSAIGFFQHGKVCVQSLSAEGIRCVADAPEPGGAAWRGTAASGEIVFASGAKLMHLNLTSSSLREVPVHFPAGQFPWYPRFLPEGEDLVVTGATRGRDNQTLYHVSSRDGALTRLIDTPYIVEFARHPHNGKWYMMYGARLPHSPSPIPALMAVPVNPATGEATGAPAQLVEAIGTNPSASYVAATHSNIGKIVFRRHKEAAPVYQIRWYAPDGKVLASLGDKRSIKEIALSSDESEVAAITDYPRRNIFLFDARSGKSRRLTQPADRIGEGLAWSPDGGTLYYQIERPDGTWSIVRQGFMGATRREAIGHSEFAVILMDISPDGKYLIFGPTEEKSSPLFRLRTDGAPDSKLEMWASAGANFGVANARFTRDGKFVFASVGRNEARFIPWHPEQPAAAADIGVVPFPLLGRFFSPDGRRICGPDRDRNISCVSVTAAPDGHPLLGPPSMQFGNVEAMLGHFSKIGAIARDGRFLLFTTDDTDELGWQLVTDWTTLLR